MCYVFRFLLNSFRWERRRIIPKMHFTIQAKRRWKEVSGRTPSPEAFQLAMTPVKYIDIGGHAAWFGFEPNCWHCWQARQCRNGWKLSAICRVVEDSVKKRERLEVFHGASPRPEKWKHSCKASSCSLYCSLFTFLFFILFALRVFSKLNIFAHDSSNIHCSHNLGHGFG